MNHSPLTSCDVACGMGLPRAQERPGAESLAARTPQERFRGMVDDNLGFISRTLRRMGVPPAEVEDASQRVFLTAHRRLSSIEHGKERAFLVGTALRVASKARRARSRREGLLGRIFAWGLPSSLPTPEDMLLQGERRVALDRLLDELPSDMRLAFVLFELEELPAREVALLLELPAGTVASRVRRARALMEKKLARGVADV